MTIFIVNLKLDGVNKELAENEFQQDFDAVRISEQELSRIKTLLENSIVTLRVWIEEPSQFRNIEILERHMVDDKSLLKKLEGL